MVRFPYFLTCYTDNELSHKFFFGFPRLNNRNQCREDHSMEIIILQPERRWRNVESAVTSGWFKFILFCRNSSPKESIQVLCLFKSFHLNFLTKNILEWSNQTKKCALFCVSICNDCIIVIKKSKHGSTVSLLVRALFS